MSATTTDLEKAAPKRQSKAADVVDNGFAIARYGQEASLAAARDFIDLVDNVLPIQGGDQSLRRKMIDGAFSMADTVAAAQLAATRSVIHRPSMPAVNLALKMFELTDINVNVGVSVPTNVGVNAPTEVGVTVPTNVDVFNLKNTSGARQTSSARQASAAA
jgi:hypothetical protein